MTDVIKTSASAIESFDDSSPFGCKRRWYFEKVLRLPVPPRDNLTLGTNPLAAGAATVTSGTSSSTSALGLASVQINQAAVTAANTSAVATTPFAGVQVGATSGSQLMVNGNQASANSTGNSVANTVSVNAGNIAVYNLTDRTPVAGTLSLNAAGTVVTFTPPAVPALPPVCCSASTTAPASRST